MAEAGKQLMNIVRRMDSGNARDAVLAREELEQMGPLAVTRLVAELQKTPRVGKKMSMLLLGARIVLLPVLLIGVVIAAVLALVVATDGAVGCIGDVGCLGDWFSGWNLREQYHERLHDRQWNQIARALAQMNDLRVVGPLAEACDFADANTRPVLTNSLGRLLPSFSTEEAHALTVGQRQALYRLLEEVKNHSGTDSRNLSLAILRIPILAEDVQAMDVVKRVAANAAVNGVAEAALQTAEQLEAIAGRLQISQSLLRGASAPTTAPDMLLRPAQGNSSPQQPEQLLRAVISQNPTEQSDTEETK